MAATCFVHFKQKVLFILLNLIVFSLFLTSITADYDECNAANPRYCSEGRTTSAEERRNNHIYTKEINTEWESYVKTIEDAVRSHKPCKGNCSCFTSVLRADLKPWKLAGINKEMIETMRNDGTFYQIINHKLYRDKECMFPFRCRGIEHFVHEILDELPDMEFVLNTRDWPQVPKHFSPRPVFSFSKTNDYYDIMYPAWTFWEGGPAIKLYPTGLGRWDLLRETMKIESEKYPWEKKSTKAFFRGSRTSSERDPLVLLSRSQPDLVDAQYTKNQAWKSEADTLGFPPADEVPLEHHCHYKYLFNYRGVAASFRFKHLFLCKSLVFHVGDEWLEFFYPALKPWVHYIPIAKDASKHDLEDILLFARGNDKLVKEIAERGYEFIWTNLHIDSVRCYWRKLLLRYAKLLKYVPTLDESLQFVNRPQS